MKLWLFVAGVAILGGCGRNDNRADGLTNAAPIGRTQIIDQQQATNQQSANTSTVVNDSVPHGAFQRPAQAVDTRPLSSETRYRALGTEPFWAVTVKGSVATLERPDKAERHYAVNRTDDGRDVRYLADGFAMTVTEGPCSDGMSDAHWADSVALSFGEGTLKGCGGVRSDF